MKIEEGFSVMGFWKLPDIDKAVYGVLTYVHEDVTTLKLIMHSDSRSTHYDSITGQTEKGLITLFNCSFYNKTTRYLTSQTFSVSEFVIGLELKDISQKKFTSVYIRTTNIDAWTGVTGFDHELTDSGSITKYEHPPKQVISKNNDFTIEINHLTNTKLFINTPTAEPIVREKSYLRIEYAKPQSINDVIEMANKLQDILTLCINYPVRIEEILILNDDYKNMPLDMFPQLYKSDRISHSKDRNVDSRSIPLPLLAIQKHTKDFFKDWLNNCLPSMLSLEYYYETIYNTNISSENSILNRAYAIESFDRAITLGNSLSNSEHEKLIALVSKLDVERETINWAQNKLGFNQDTFRKRINRSLSFLKSFSSNGKAPYSNKTIRMVTEDIVNLRNNLTHGNHEKLINTTAEQKKRIAHILRLAFVNILLKELGFTTKEIHKYISSMTPTYHLEQWLNGLSIGAKS